MAISKTMESAVENKDLVGIYNSFYTILMSDPGFSTGRFEEAFNYVNKKNIDGFIKKHDGKEAAPRDEWNVQYWDEVASELVDNFSIERIKHLKEVSKVIYPTVRKNINHTENVKKKVEMPQMRLKKEQILAGVIIIILIIFLIIVSAKIK